MTTVVDTSPVEARRQAIRREAENLLMNARAQGRSELTEPETVRYQAMLADLRDLGGEIERRNQANATITNLGARLAARNPSTRNTAMLDQLTYRRDNGHSYLRDLMRVSTNTDDGGESRRRLAAHADEARSNPAFQQTLMEKRDISTATGEAGYFVPPAWYVDQYAEYARPGRPFADIITRQPLPGGTNSINVPRIVAGTATGVQYPENTVVVEQDLADSFINAQVRTIAGAQQISQQLLDQSPVPMDEVVLNDLAGAWAVNVDRQVLYGSGSGGEVLGATRWPGIQTVTVADQTIGRLYAALANAINLIWSQRFAAPTAIVMHPRRWAAILAALDVNQRPLFLPEAGQGQLMNAMGVMSNVEPQALVGRALGLPIYTDASLLTNLGYGSNHDSIFVLRAQDIVIFESGLRARVTPEPLAKQLTVLVVVYSYLALAVRYPASIVEVSGFLPPTF